MSDPEALSSSQFFYAGAHLISPPSDRRHGIVDETLTPRSRPDVAVIVTTAVAHRSCSCSSTFSDVHRSSHVSQAAGVSRNQDGPCYHVAEAARVEMLHPRLTSQGTLSFLSGATLDFAATKLTRVSLMFTAKIVGTNMLSVPAYTQMQMETLIDLSEDFSFKAERCRNGRLRNFFSYWDLLVGGDQADFGENRPAAQLRDEVAEVRNRVSAGLCDVVNR
ncbi:hypothetical protein T06_3619 [Trichinella sp. T6]|nr:hypothetical protein T06_3619 [Trichinella sp. T6]